MSVAIQRPVLTAVLLSFCLPASAQPRPVLWFEPGNVAAIDFANPPAWNGKPVAPPKAPFTFLREDPSGTQPKLFARDANGATWNVKFGYEVHNECFCWRVVRACGYFAEPGFFLAAGRFEQYRPIRRATPSLSADGGFRDARFQYRDPELKFLEDRNWRWDSPPFAGTRELSGLKILIMLFSNWDNKDGRVGKGGPNTAIFQQHGLVIHPDGSRREEPWLVYAFTDWGSGMGRWGSVAGSDSNWDCAGYTAETPAFVKGVARGRIGFGWEGAINQGFRDSIPPAHAVWLMRYLGRVSDAQLITGLKAAGADDAAAACFQRGLRTRIGQLQKAAQ